MKKNHFSMIAVLCVLAMVAFGFTQNANKVQTVSAHSKVTKACLYNWYVSFYNSSGHRIELHGIGTSTSGTVTSFVSEDYSGYHTSVGTASGTFTLSGGVMTINCTYQPENEEQQTYEGECDYDDQGN